MAPPPPPHSSSSYTSFPILAISILGILTTAILLLSYYIFVIKCCLNCRHPSDLLRRLSSASRSIRRSSPPHFPSPAAAADNPRALSPSAIRSLPTLRFAKGPHAAADCAVCLADFRDADLLRLLPGCSHAFHIDCIDTWLQSSASCPLCRADVFPGHLLPPPAVEHLVIDVGRGSDHLAIDVATPRAAGGSPRPSPRKPPTPSPRKKGSSRKFFHMASMGDECIQVMERERVQPIRRSFSMDSSGDRQLYLSVQEVLQRNPGMLFREVAGSGEGSSSGGGGGASGSGRIRRGFFSFGRSSRNVALPVVQAEVV